MPEDLRQSLRDCFLFSDLEEQDLDAIEKATHTLKVKKGEIIFHEGDGAEGFFILRRGMVKVFKMSEEGREQTLHIMRPGGTFAEAAIFLGGNFPASAEALLDSTLIMVRKGPFLELLSKRPQVGIRMLGSVSLWLKRLTELIESLSIRTVQARLALYLLGELEASGREASPGAELTLDMPKKELAVQLGMAGETLSRVLRSFREKGIVAGQGRKLRLLDPARLRELAES